jgi:hypothetical protein
VELWQGAGKMGDGSFEEWFQTFQKWILAFCWELRGASGSLDMIRTG